MPVIIPVADWTSWLQTYSLPPQPPTLTCRPVSMKVNMVKFDDPDCLAPAPVQTDLFE